MDVVDVVDVVEIEVRAEAHQETAGMRVETIEVRAEAHQETAGMRVETIHLTVNGREIRRTWPESTKCCPLCFNDRLILLRTLHLKFCSDCNTEVVWGLDPGQTTLA